MTYSATTGSPNQYSIDFDETLNTAGRTDIGFTNFSSSPITFSIPGNILPATYNAILTVRNSNNCVSNQYPITLTITSPPVPSLTHNLDIICSGVPMDISTDDGMSNYTWGITGGVINSGAGTSSVNVTFTNMTADPITEFVFVNYTSPAGCRGTNFTVGEISVLPQPNVTASSNSPVCEGSTLNLYSTDVTGATYSWTDPNGNVISTTQNAVLNKVTPAAAGTYSVTVTKNGCSTVATTDISVNALPITNGSTINYGSATASLQFLSACSNPGTTGAKIAGTGSNNNSNSGNVTWGTTSGITAVGGSTANVTVGNGEFTSYLQASNFGFAIPSTATINTITVAINRSTSGSTLPLLQDYRVSLVKTGGVAESANKAKTGIDWPGSLTTETYGGDLWGTSWSPGEINNSGFGVVLSAINYNGTRSRDANVDNIQITVTYTTPDGVINWYASDGTTLIGHGTSFNPVNQTNSGLTNTSCYGIYNFYGECSNVPGCKTLTTVTVIDNVPPVITAANGSSTVSCLAMAVSPTTIPVANDNCDGTIEGILFSTVDTPDPLSCDGTRVYTYSYTDKSGNVSYWTFTYTIETKDFTMPSDDGKTVSCVALAVAPTLPVVTDNCGNILTPSVPVISTAPVCNGIMTYTYTYTDCIGNTHNWVYTYTIERQDFTMPANDGKTVSCVALAVAPTLPVVTDNCGNILTPSVPVISTAPECNGSVIYTYTYTDCIGNAHDWVYTYTIDRQDFVMPANDGKTVSCVSEVVAPTLPTVTDNCGNVLTPGAPVISTAPVCNGAITYTYPYIDCVGNTHNWVYTYTIERMDFSMPANDGKTVACVTEVVAPTLPTVIDNCGNLLTPGVPVISSAPACNGNMTYTYAYTDCAGNTHNWVYTYTIERKDFSMPANDGKTVSCVALAVDPTLPVVTDNCGNILTPGAPIISASPACEGDMTYTYTYTDCAGNFHDWVYTYTIKRLDFTMPSDDGKTVSCVALAVAPTLPVVTDNCGNILTPSVPVISTAPVCNGIMTYTYTYTDCIGNTHNWVYTYTIERQDFTMPANDGKTVSCVALAVAPTLPVVTDNCGNILTPSVPVISTAPECNGSVIYTYTYTDCIGNTHDWVYTYTIDRQDFVMPANDGKTVSCVSEVVAPTLPTVTDNCGNVLTPGAPVISTAPVCNGAITYTYPYIDCVGNTHNWVYTYTIERMDFSMPANDGKTVACVTEVVAPTLPTVIDNCGNLLTPGVPVISSAPACNGNMTYTYAYTDCAGNTHNWVYTYTIERKDFSMPANDGKTVSCVALAVDPTLPVVTDNCGNILTPGAPIISASPACEGDMTYTYTYTDCAGNFHDWVYTYTIKRLDFTMPSDDGKTVSCVALAVTPTLPVVTDNCGNILTPSAPVISTAPVCNGIMTYTYTYTDCIGNTHNWVYTYTIERQDFTMPANDGKTVSNVALAVPPTLPVVTDNCGNILTPSAPAIVPAPACKGEMTYTYTFTDCIGNTHNWVYTYTILDDIPPTAVAQDITIYLDASGNASITAGAVDNGSSDNCGIASMSLSKTIFNCSNVGENAVILTVTDVNGNFSTATAKVTVVDNIQPTVITQAVSITLDANGNGSITSAQVDNGSNDACGIQSMVLSKTNFTTADVLASPVMVTLTVTDNHGNVGTGTALVTISTIQITVKAVAITKVYGDPDPLLTYTFSPALIGSDSFSGGLSRVDGKDVNTYAINQGTLTLPGYYTIKYEKADLTITARPITVAAEAKTKMFGESDPDLTYKVTSGSFAFGEDCTGALDRLDGENIGTYPINQGTLALTGNYALTFVGADFTITAKTSMPSVTVSPTSVQYSDMVTFTAKISVGAMLISGRSHPEASVTFKVGNQEMGTVPLKVKGLDLEGKLTTAMIEKIKGQMAPGNKTVYAVFNFPNSKIKVTPNPATTNLTITREDVRVNYTGSYLETGSGSGSKSSDDHSNVFLRATVQDITAVRGDHDWDPFAGDIRNAKVRFLKGSVPITNWLTPDLVNGRDSKTGVVSAKWGDFGLSADIPGDINIEVGGNGYYVRNNPADLSVVTLYAPNGDYVAGGGYLVNPYHSDGTYAGDPGLKTNFGFVVKYKNKGTNLQGNMDIIFRREVDGVIHTYQVNSTSITSLGVNVASHHALRALIVAKANLNDITDPGLPVLLGSLLKLQVSLTDNGESGVSDMIGISLWDGSTLLFSSNWTGSNTSEKQIGDGNLIVHSGSSFGDINNPPDDHHNEHMLSAELGVKAYPNPFTDHVYFDLMLQTESKVRLEIYDVTGARIATLFNDVVLAYNRYQLEYTPENFSSGVLIYRLIIDDQIAFTGKLIHK